MTLTNSGILSQIRQLTREKDKCTALKNEYNKSLEFANKLVSNLNNSNKHLDLSVDYLKQYFTINGNIANNYDINTTKNNINQLLKKMTNTIIPNIKNEISSLTQKINRLQREINNLSRQLN